MIEYPDTCVIGRSEGLTDENGDEILTPVYSGECMLQVDGSVKYDGFQFENEPVLFIPVNDVMLTLRDSIKVTTFYGREISYLIRNWEPIRSEFEELNNTCVWLRDGNG